MTIEEASRITGRSALDETLESSGVRFTHTTLGALRQDAVRLFEQLRSGDPNVIVIDTDSVLSLDVMALRWMYPNGVTPLVLCPSNVQECAELADIAAAAANLIPGPVFILLEQAVADSEESLSPTTEPELMLPDTPPVDFTEIGDKEAEIRTLENRANTPLEGFPRTVSDICPAEMGKPEWLVLSYGSTSAAASEAVRAARAQNQRVNHLRLLQLWPLPEPDILRALRGIKHTVMAERNLGQYAHEVRRIAPEMPVVPATSATGPVTIDMVLTRLQNTPRCC